MSTAPKSIFPSPLTSIKPKRLAWNWTRQLPEGRALYWQGKQVCLMRLGGLTGQQSFGASKGRCLSQKPHSFPKVWLEQAGTILSYQPPVCPSRHGGEKPFSPPGRILLFLQLLRCWIEMYTATSHAGIIPREMTYFPISRTRCHPPSSLSYTERRLGEWKFIPFSCQSRGT